MHAPHIPVASTMIELRLATVGTRMPGEVAHRTHHEGRADRHDLGHASTLTERVRVEHLLERPGHEARDPEGSVVGGADDVELVTELSPELADPPVRAVQNMSPALRKPEMRVTWFPARRCSRMIGYTGGRPSPPAVKTTVVSSG